jgi:hypothetical protein
MCCHTMESIERHVLYVSPSTLLVVGQGVVKDNLLKGDITMATIALLLTVRDITSTLVGNISCDCY